MIPIVIAENGLGVPVVQTENATPMTIAANGLGMPVVIVEEYGIPVTIDNLPEPEE